MSQTKAQLIDGQGEINLGGLDIDASAPDGSVNLDSSGRLLVGTTTAVTTGSALIQGAGTTGCFYIAARNDTTVVADDSIGGMRFYGNDSDGNYDECGRIECAADGTHGDTSKPSRLRFLTTASSASNPTERCRISADGKFRMLGTSSQARIIPNVDNVGYLGEVSFRWQAVYAVNGTIQTSDFRQKTDIKQSTLGSDFIKALNPVSYKWIEGGKEPSEEVDKNGNPIFTSVPGLRTHWGFIAQEVKDTVDAAGVDFGGWVLTDKDDPDSQQALRYDQFIAPLTKALQEALAKIETLETKVAALEAQ